jgi:catechol 2,3-dioxygenase-like lactoylglutathione lyase family enzyme
MVVAFHATKLTVRDVDAAELFYLAIGLRVAGRNSGGDREMHQKQVWLSVTGDSTSHVLILNQFLELPPPAPTTYPGELWLAFNVADVDGTVVAIEAAGGSVIRAAEDIVDHGVRAAVLADPEGHVIEIVGPMRGAAGQVADPLARGLGDG